MSQQHGLSTISSLISRLSDYSLDAPCVGIVWLSLFEQLAEVSVPPSTYVILFIAIWLAYVADRMFDLLTLDKGSIKASRHAVHSRHRKFLVVLWMLMFLGSITWSVVFLESAVLYRGFGLVGAIVFYFASIQSRGRCQVCLWYKEVVVAIIFGTGVAFFIWLSGPSLPGLLAYFQGLFTLLCLVNLLLIAQWEYPVDVSQNRTGLSTYPHWLERILWGSVGILIFGGIVGAYWGDGLLGVAVLIAVSALMVLNHWKDRFDAKLRRTLADLALVLPVLLLIG